MKRIFLIFVFMIVPGACRENHVQNEPGSKSATLLNTGKKSGAIVDRLPAQLPDSSRFKKIRKLLGKDPDSAIRAYNLYPQIDPICTSTHTRMKFVADAAAYVDVRDDPADRAHARRLAVDTIEHVATSCWRNYPPAAFQILEAGKKLITSTRRFDIVIARLKSAGGEFETALKYSDAAIKAGSVHAIALSANIRAQIARKTSTIYKAGMLDEAIEIVSTPPGANWRLIDLTAVLATRARLLSERANWESGEQQKKTLMAARHTYGRMSVGPFIEVTRRQALDALCYDAVLLGSDPIEPCDRAAREFQNLGAAFLSGHVIERPSFDQNRFESIASIRDRIDTMKAGRTIVIVARGDEQEIIAWTRPAATALARLKGTKARVILVDRTYSKRASVILDRIVELAGIKPSERIEAGRDTFAMPCLTALLAGRRTPRSCPFDKKLIKRLLNFPPFELAFLIGRDLDAEIDDLRLYDLDAILLSYRLSLTENKPIAHFKDLTDAWLLAPNSKHLAGRFKVAHVKP